MAITPITEQNLDQYVGWTLVSEGNIEGGDKPAFTIRFRSPSGTLVDIIIVRPGVLFAEDVSQPTRNVNDCVKSPTGIHNWRRPLRQIGIGLIGRDLSQPERCILCDVVLDDA